MRNAVLILVLTAFAVGTAPAYPGMNGSRGLFRVHDARSEGNWNGTLMLRGVFATWPGDRWDPVGVGFEPGTALYAQEALAAVSLSPVKWFELFCYSGGIRETASTSAIDTAFYGYHSFAPGLKISIPVIPLVKLGVMGTYSTYPILDDFRGGWAWGRFSTPFVNGITWTGLVTLDLPERQPWTPVVHLNYGQAYDAYETPGGTVKTTYATTGVAAEYEIGKLDLFAEFVSVQTGSSPFGSSGKMYLTPGVRIGYLKPLVLEGGLSFGLTREVAPVEIYAGLGLSGSLYKPRVYTTGNVTGTVTDAGTGKPLTAMVSFPAETEPAPVMTDPTLGTFKARGVRPGTIAIRVEAEGYLSAEQAVEVTAGKTSRIDIALKPRPTAGSLAGRVTDPATGRPLAASVTLKETSIPPATTDSEGRYTFVSLPTGTYTAEASSEGYLTATRSLQIEPDKETRADFTLVRREVTIPLMVYFDFNEATIKLPESKEALDAAARILQENPGIRVEIQGHTDEIGTDAYNQRLSERRAASVVKYLVENYGIAANRLTSVGFGRSRPKADNSTEEGRAQNRRVEFMVLPER
ncbi:MAG: OmpA family protein [candidate division WOR-3 bacterium]